MKTWEGLKRRNKVVNKEDGMVMEFIILYGKKYLASKNSLFSLSQFEPDNFEMYNGDLEVGDTDLSIL